MRSHASTSEPFSAVLTHGRITAVRRLALALVVGALLWSSSASAQSGSSTGFAFEQFEPSPSQETAILNLDRPVVVPHLTPSIGLVFDVSDDPVQRVADNDRDRVLDRVVDDRYQLQLGAALGLFDFLEVGVAVPLVVRQTGSAVTGTSPSVGDIRSSLKVAILRPERTAGFGLAVSGTMYVPTGSRADFTSDGVVRGVPSVSFGWRAPNGAEIDANIGYEFGPEITLPDYTGGRTLRWGVGGRIPIGETPVTAFTTLFGRQSTVGELGGRSDPMEVAAGARIDLPAHFRLQVGGSAGLSDGVGTPDFRVFAGVDWTRIRRDDDGDGIANDADECPERPEDWDDFEDEDGCPDPDNDGDGITDDRDDCPDTPGPRSNDGCPVGDRDDDGIPDDEDECPDEPEDEDGFEDDDGCPDPDNDGDGIPDDEDECPNDPETYNGVEDEDGCPDSKKTKAKVVEQEIDISEKIHFESEKAVIEKRSYQVLQDVARILRTYDEITKVVIEGHTDSRGPKRYNEQLSAARANAVRQFLMERGIDAERLQSVGLGSSEPIATNDTAEGRAQNRRVEFDITQIRGEPLEEGEPALLVRRTSENDDSTDDDSADDDSADDGSADDSNSDDDASAEQSESPDDDERDNSSDSADDGPKETESDGTDTEK